MEAILGDDVNCGCRLTFPFNIQFSCKYTESYCIGPQNVLELCGLPKLTGRYGLGVSASTEICFIDDGDKDPVFEGDFCLKGYHSPNFIQFNGCDAKYDNKDCEICEACPQTGFFFRFDCGAAGGPVVPCIGLGNS